MDDLSRRDFLKKSALAAVATQIPALAHAQPASASPADGAVTADGAVELHWLEADSAQGSAFDSAGCTWGVPWPRGAFDRKQKFSLQTQAGEDVPVQTWPIAYWPDGSLKWSAHAIASKQRGSGRLLLKPGKEEKPPNGVMVRESAQTIDVDTGVVQYVLSRSGRILVQTATRGGKVIAQKLRLVCMRQDRSEQGKGVIRQEPFSGVIESATVEQQGPVRAVVKFEGRHRVDGTDAGRAWLPFCLRFYFYASSDALRIVHSFIYDGDMDKDYIQGLGVRFDVPMQDALHDRHVRFVGENGGIWGEAVRNLSGLRRDAGDAVLSKQFAGLPCPPVSEFPDPVRAHLDDIPAWGDYALFQPSADSFEIRKRIGDWGCWLNGGYGRRSAGTGYIGGITGGVAFGIRDFWQRHPTQLDIRNAAGDEAEVTMWLWSADAPAMDMRHYDRVGHNLDITYEDWEEGFDNPMGVARTTELMLWTLSATPSREALVDFSKTVQTPPLLVCNPAYYQSLHLFGGMWTVPDRSNSVRKTLEDRLDALFDFYRKEVEQRHWYGFWHYGDVMHAYDRNRHTWRYDVGGFAWDNSELSPDLWLWYSFLRTGRADIFRFAEALTRHTGEVDVHHIGRFAGLGSRHAVVHWGDSAKQVRVSQSTYRRIFYYLTADERVGDLMRQLVDSDHKLLEIDPIRKVAPKTTYPTHANIGPDWFAFASNWLTEWERTGDTRWRDKIIAGMRSIAAMPHGLFSGAAFGYDPATSKLYNINGDRMTAQHLTAVFGGVEICAELATLIDEPGWDKAWLDYCEFYNASPEERNRALGGNVRGNGLPQAYSRLTAYAAWRKKDRALAERAAREFSASGPRSQRQPNSLRAVRVEPPAVLNPVEEIPWISTNDAAQWSLAAIQNLALIGDVL